MKGFEINASRPGEPGFRHFAAFPEKIYPEGSQRFMCGHEPTEENLIGCYIFSRENDPMGRMALYDNPEMTFRSKPVLLLGSYECIEDDSVAAAMISFAAERAMERKKEYLIGPMDGSTWHNYRFTVQGDAPLFFQEPYHHSYYPVQFKNNGFMPIATYISREDLKLEYDTRELTEAWSRYAERGGRLRKLRFNDLKRDLYRIGIFCNRAFSDNFLFTPLNPEAFAEKFAGVRRFMDEDIVWVVEDEAERIHAIALNLPDHFDKKRKGLIVKTLARDPESPFRGIGRYLAGKSYQAGSELGYNRFVHAFMKLDNPSVAISSKYLGEPLRTYELYALRI